MLPFKEARAVVQKLNLKSALSQCKSAPLQYLSPLKEWQAWNTSISADLVHARSEKTEFLCLNTDAEYDDFLRGDALRGFEDAMTVVEAADVTVADQLFAVHRLKGDLWTLRLTEMGDLANQIETELKEIRARGEGRLVSGSGSAVAELRRRLDWLGQSLRR